MLLRGELRVRAVRAAMLLAVQLPRTHAGNGQEWLQKCCSLKIVSKFCCMRARAGVLALIDRNFQGFGKELFTDAGKYVIHFGSKPSEAAEQVPLPSPRKKAVRPGSG